MFRPIREFFTALSDAQQAIITILGVVTMIAIGWGTAIEWLNKLSLLSKIWYSLAVLCLILIFIISFVTWWRKHDVDNIPKYLNFLDEMVREYVNNIDPNTLPAAEMASASADLGDLWHIDIKKINEAIQRKDKIQLKQLSYTISNRFNRMIDEKDRSNSTMKSLLVASGIMNYHGIGLDRVKNTSNYQKIFNKVKKLQQLVPSVEVNIKINEYWNWSDGLYSILLNYRFIMDKPQVLALLPANERASTSYVGRQIEGSAATLLSAVRESLEKARHKDK